MGGEEDADGFSPNVVDDAFLDRLRDGEPDRPARATFRRRTADHRDKRGLLRAVQDARRRRSDVVSQRLIDATFEVSLSNS
jgi:hypothetical protein